MCETVGISPHRKAWKEAPLLLPIGQSCVFYTKVWDLDYLNKGEFLGEVRLSMQDLAEQVPVDGSHEFTAALRPKSSATDKFNRLVQGSLRFTCQVSFAYGHHGLSRCEQAREGTFG